VLEGRVVPGPPAMTTTASGCSCCLTRASSAGITQIRFGGSAAR